MCEGGGEVEYKYIKYIIIISYILRGARPSAGRLDGRAIFIVSYSFASNYKMRLKTVNRIETIIIL